MSFGSLPGSGVKLQNAVGDAMRVDLARFAYTTVPYTVTISGANAPVTAFFGTVTNYQWSPGKVIAGYSAAPTGGKLTVSDYAGNVYLSIPIGSAGSQTFDLDRALMPVSTGMVLELTAGSGSVVGHLNVLPYKDKVGI